MPRDSSAARIWLARARSNLALAKQPKPKESLWEDLCFQAQQAAEKALKAVYQHRGLRFRFTHDLEELSTNLGAAGITLPPFMRDVSMLTTYASETRYPGTFEPMEEAEYQEAVQLAEAVVRWAEYIIGKPEDTG